MENRKILFIIHDINYSGAAKMLSFIANGLSEIGYQVVVYTYAGNKPYYPLNSSIYYIPALKVRYSYVEKLLYFIDVQKMIKRINPDIVISFLPNSNMFSIIGTAFSKIPVIICERSDPYYEKGTFLELKRSLFKYADGAVFQTERAQRYYPKILQEKSVVIPNPVTIKKIDRIPLNKRNDEISFVGRFYIRQKRQDIMLKAFKKVAEIDKQIKLVFYGDGPDLPQIQQMAKDMNLSERVIFKGKVNDVVDSIKDSKMFVLTSDYEGIPNALIEAMAIGLPVISTDCSPGGARLLIENKKNGLLIDTNDVDKIADAILFLINNPEVADSYGIEAQKIVNKFTARNVMQLWSEYIEQIINFTKC